MPSLAQTLPSNDIGFLRIVASLWGLELASTDPAEAAIELAESLCDAELLEEVVTTLPKDARATLESLAASDGRMPWVAFARRFGDVREMGPGKRDREQPHLRPSSGAEVLWYRALLARAFFEGEKGPQEFAFIPDDLLMAMDFAGLLGEAAPEPPSVEEDVEEDEGEEEQEEHVYVAEDAPVEYEIENISDVDEPPVKAPIKAPTKTTVKPPVVVPAQADEKALGRPASPAEKAVQTPASDRILDDACTYLAAMRLGMEPPHMSIPATVIHNFLAAAGLVGPAGLNPEAVKAFLEAPRKKALTLLLESWQSSESFDELRQLPGLSFEGAWTNQPLVTREFLLNLLEPVPDGQWWSLTSFVRDIKSKYPDYQRPAGDYDSWFIKREADGVFLRGFANWDDVDGALIRYFICGPLHWLGMLDLSAQEENGAPTAFRARPEPVSAEESGKITVTSRGKINVPRLSPRAARYQIARFCEWEEPKNDEYRYRISAGSLKRAREQGLKPDHLLGILRKHVSAPIPPSLVKALQRWEANGSEARVESMVVLKVSRPEVLKELRDSKAGRFLGEPLGTTTVVIQGGAQSQVLAALIEMGLLAEGQIEE